MPVVISVAGRFSGDVLRYLDEQIALFEESNPDIRVELVQLKPDPAERRDELIAALEQRDSSIDVMMLDLPWLTELAQGGGLVPLQGYTSTLGVVPGDLLTPTIEATTVDGQWLALPWTANAGVLYYRRDLMDKYGFRLDSAGGTSDNTPLTWADVQRIALQVKAGEGLPDGFVWQGAANETLTCNMLEHLWAEGGQVLDGEGRPSLDTPQAHAALQQMVDLIQSGASPAEVTALDEDKSLASFAAGNAVLARSGVYAWQGLNAEDSPVAGRVGVAQLPASCLGGQALGLSAYSLQKQAALRFMAFMIEKDAQSAVARGAGLAPARQDVYKDLTSGGDGPWSTLYRALSLARPRPRTPKYARLSPIIYTEVHRMLAGEQDAATTAARAQRQAESLIQNGDTP
jgi:multiple sugar transport system substrate-binding protein